MEKVVKDLVAGLNSSRMRWQLFYELPQRQFYQLEGVENNSTSDMFLFKYCQPTSINITIQGEPVPLFYGNLYSLYNKDTPVGMVVTTPKMQQRVYSECLITAPKSMRDIDSLDDTAEIRFMTPEFAVYVLDSTVQYVSAFNPSVQSVLGQ